MDSFNPLNFLADIALGNYKTEREKKYQKKLFTCRNSGCFRSFPRPQSRGIHEKYCRLKKPKKNIPDKLFICRNPGCFKSFPRPQSRGVHEKYCKKITVRKKYTCPYCPYTHYLPQCIARHISCCSKKSHKETIIIDEVYNFPCSSNKDLLIKSNQDMEKDEIDNIIFYSSASSINAIAE